MDKFIESFSQRSTSQKILITIGVTIFFLVLIGASYFLSSPNIASPKNPNFQNSLPTPTPIVEKVLPSSQWQTYTSGDFSFSYPPALTLFDGVPETKEKNDTCFDNGGPSSDPQYCTNSPTYPPPACRCFDTNQDPTNLATQIKQSGVTIFSIGYVSAEDSKFQNDLQNLMTNVASPGNFYPAPITNQITDILSSITDKVCPQGQ